MLQDEIKQPDKLKFFDDHTSICKDFPKSKFTLLIHDDILTRQKDEGFSKGPLGRRLTMVITFLIAHGRTSVVKGVRGEENRGWRRSPLGGNHGNHFYLWWAPCKAPPVMGINVSDNTIFLRAVRHHDDHSHLNSGELSDFHLINTHDLTKDTDFKLPWTQEQRSFIHALSPIRILRGQPGSGKTVSLWQSIQLRPDENVLYLTWSSRLADLAREYFETFASLGSSFRVVIFTDLLHELAGKTPQALAIEEGRRIFLEAISKLSPAQLGPWANYSSTLYSEVRAHYVGAFLPIINGYATNKIDSTIQIKDYQLRRAGYLGKSIEGVISSIKAIEGRALIGSCFPDLALAWEACEKLTSDLAVTTKDLIINRIVLDEVQDLTPIEALAFILLARKIGEKNNGAAPFLLITGDEGQTVRPTDFEWPWLKNLISKVLRPPEDLSLISNLRNPSKINRFVCAISDLYEFLPKQDRPRGQEHIDEEEGTIGELIYCETADNTSLTNLITKLTNLTYLFISLSEPPPKFLKGENTSECLSVFEAKGLEFQKVCVVNPGCFLGSILKSEHDEVVLSEVKRIWKRSNIDHMRVAVSRATETLILLDVDAKEKDNKHFKKILENNDVLTLSPEELLKYLDSDDHDLESKIQMFLETARSLIDVRPELALQRARQAAHLFEGDGSTANSGDVNLQNDVYLMIMRSVFQCIAIGAGSHNALLREAYETSMTCEKTGISQVILSFIDFQNEQDESKKFSLFVKLLEKKTKVSVNDRWALNGFNRLYADLKGSLLEFAADTKYCDQISENLNYYFDAIGVPKENIEQESNDILLCLAKNLVSIGSFQKAIEIAKLIHPEPKELLAVWQKSIETKSLQDKEQKEKQLVAPFSEATGKEMQKELAKSLGKEVEEKEDLGNGIKLEMVLIPAGKFVMGSPINEVDRNDDETQHDVTLTNPYYFGKYEVTQEQYESVMGKNPSQNKGAKLPVTNVSWEDCQEFIKKLNSKTNGGYRLSTEAEWEYACRAGATTAYAFGERIRKSDANFDADLSTKVVGSYKPNRFGLYDMQGNVWEWCEDYYGAYPKGSVTDPKGPASGISRVLRGGSFINYGSSARSSCRNCYTSSSLDYGNRGFRLARTAETKAVLEPTVLKSDLVEVVPELGNLLVAPFSEVAAKEMQKLISVNLQREVEEKEDLGNGIKLEMVLIPAGKFVMGSPASEEGHFDDNELQHDVTLTMPYYLGKYEVTQEQWVAVMGYNRSKIKGSKLPVTDVSWEDCQEFVKKVNAKTNGGYRLPSEAEWEYGCRAGTMTAYSFGDKITPKDANYNASKLDNPLTVGKAKIWPSDSNSGVSKIGKPVTVGNYEANPFGLYDMHGNVSEWCEDWKADYPEGSVTDPKGPATGTHRVLRGGAFDDFGRFVRASSRLVFTPPGRYLYGGFRLARTIDSKSPVVPTAPKLDSVEVVPELGNLLVAPFSEATAKEMQKEIAINLRKAVEEKEDLSKGIKLEMVLIPAGKFTMGATFEEINKAVNRDSVFKGKKDKNLVVDYITKREPEHEVTLSQPYYMAKYEVTQEQWEAVMGSNPSDQKVAKFPVTNVSWNDCQEFIKKLNAKTSGGYRLPTEAEWEYACRAGTSTVYSVGDELSKNDANYDGENIKEVGSYNPNTFGLYDMHGNVFEWCQDWYEDYLEGAVTDPKGPATGKDRLLRGGSFNFRGLRSRSADRRPDAPSTGRYDYGFRLARTADFKIAITPTVPKSVSVEIVPALGNLLVASFSEATAKDAQKEIAKSLHKEVEEKADLGKGIKLEMVLIPAGKFTMGSPANEKGRYDNEAQHEVTLTKPFYMGKYTVTQEQWEVVMGSNPCTGIKGAKLPVTNISWNDCQEFIKKLNANTKGGYMLPSEAEWEYACRAGTTTAYSFGDKITPKDANYRDSKMDNAVVVGNYKPNPFGLYDMHGNVWEWCEDWFGDYPTGAVTNPKGQAMGERRVSRGGSFLFLDSTVRSSDRNYCRATYGNINLGFRLAMTILSPFTPSPNAEPIGFFLEASKTEILVLEESTGTLKTPSESEHKASKSEKDLSSDTFSDHNFADSFTNLDSIFYDQKKDAETLSDNTSIIQQNPEDATIYNNRGESLYKKQRYFEAIADYSKAIEMEPRYALAYSNRGVAYCQLKEYPKAIADYTKAINMYCELKDHLETIDDNIKATELVDPCLIVVYLARGTVHTNQQNYLKAITDFTKAIKLYHKSKLSDASAAMGYTSRGYTYYRLKKYPEAITDYTKAIKLEPKFANHYFLRGTAYKALGKTKEANEDFAKAKELEK